MVSLMALALLAGHASSSEEGVLLIVSLHLTFVQNRALLDLQPYTRSLVPATFQSCFCTYQLMIVVKRLSQSLMRLRLVLETLSMAVSLTFLPYNNRYTIICSYKTHLNYGTLCYFFSGYDRSSHVHFLCLYILIDIK